MLSAEDAGDHVEPSRSTVGEWLEEWVAATKAEISPKTHERYAEIVRCYLKPGLGAMKLQKLTTGDIQRAYGEFDRNPSPRTRRHVNRILKSALASAVEQQRLTRNPAASKVGLPKVERKPASTLTVEQSGRLLAAIRHTTTYWPVLIALATGMRRGEILALRWKNVELDNGAVRVVESLEQTKAGLRFKAPKAEKARAVPLPRFALAELKDWKRKQAEALLRLGVRQDGDTLVCPREDGKPKQPDSLTHEFTYLVGRATDVPRVRFHDLRHSHATQLLSAGVHPKIVQERLGHSTIAITLDLYSHVSDTMQANAARTLDGMYGERGAGLD
ncbi:MAG: site-specific integrase [Roseiarcus sp.]|uniref:tyrosine-type recombinase/integrase n=1 Tax=Roseiarcus sp. TaxID=1969460 RepID=UPI003C413111